MFPLKQSANAYLSEMVVCMSIKIKASYTKDWEGDYIRRLLKEFSDRARIKETEKPPYKILYITTQESKDTTTYGNET